MSIVHIKVEKIKESDVFVEYRILCSDFNQLSRMEDFGVIRINKDEKEFIHTDDALWIKNRIYPIKLFRLPLDERKRLVERDYGDYGSGLWAIRLLKFVDECVDKNSFPEEKLLIA